MKPPGKSAFPFIPPSGYWPSFLRLLDKAGKGWQLNSLEEERAATGVSLVANGFQTGPSFFLLQRRWLLLERRALKQEMIAASSTEHFWVALVLPGGVAICGDGVGAPHHQREERGSES